MLLLLFFFFLQTLLKISGAVFEVNKTNNPLFTTEGLPALKHEKRNLHNFHHILTYLNEKVNLTLKYNSLAEIKCV